MFIGLNNRRGNSDSGSDSSDNFDSGHGRGFNAKISVLLKEVTSGVNTMNGKENPKESLSRTDSSGGYGTLSEDQTDNRAASTSGSEITTVVVKNRREKGIDDDTYFQQAVNIPDCGDYAFSWRKLWAFTGPGFLMSIAYLDPGNIESDLQSGSIAKYHLLWVLMWSTIFGLVVQRLAARIGTVTGLHLAELCYRRYPVVPRLGLWVMTEVAIIGSDMQEVIGTAISLYLLSNGRIPLYGGVLITICDTFTFLLLDKYGLRKLEAFFCFLILVMAVTFGYEYFVVGPEELLIFEGLAIPWCSGCQPAAFLQAVGIIGSIIMPHNLYLHSALVKSRKVDRTKSAEVRDANRYVFIESAVALGVSLFINIMITGVFAHGLYGRTNAEVHGLCVNRSITDTSFVDKPDELVDADLYNAGIFLGCAFGMVPMYIWAVGIFAAGQSSTMTGTYAGQFAMEGFLNLSWSRWKRVLLTRTIAIFPTLFVTIYQNIGDLSGMNELLNALMSLMLPFALLPTLTFSSSKKVMGEFANGFVNKILVSCLSIVVIGVNLYFVKNFVTKHLPDAWWVYLLTALFFIYYLAFVVYLTGCFLVVLGFNWVTSLPYFGKYMEEGHSVLEFKYGCDYRNINDDHPSSQGSSPPISPCPVGTGIACNSR